MKIQRRYIPGRRRRRELSQHPPEPSHTFATVDKRSGPPSRQVVHSFKKGIATKRSQKRTVLRPTGCSSRLRCQRLDATAARCTNGEDTHTGAARQPPSSSRGHSSNPGVGRPDRGAPTAAPGVGNGPHFLSQPPSPAPPPPQELWGGVFLLLYRTSRRLPNSRSRPTTTLHSPLHKRRRRPGHARCASRNLAEHRSETTVNGGCSEERHFPLLIEKGFRRTSIALLRPAERSRVACASIEEPGKGCTAKPSSLTLHPPRVTHPSRGQLSHQSPEEGSCERSCRRRKVRAVASFLTLPAREKQKK